MKKLIIIHSLTDISKKIPLIKEEGIGEWIPFVSEYGTVKRIEEKLIGTASRKDISTELQGTASEVRRDFFEKTAELGKKYNSLAWWAHSISERNTMASKLFLRCCYMVMAEKILSSGQDLCMVCDSNSVIDNIEKLALRHGYEVTKKKSRKFYIWGDTVSWRICAGIYSFIKGLFLVYPLTKINRFVHAKSAKEKRREIKETDIIIHTWADKKSLGEDGKFNDRYFTVLPEFYKDKGYKVATLVDLFLLNRKPVAYWKALTFLRKNSGQFIIAEDYYSVWDYFWPLRLGLKKNGFRFDNVTIGGVDCSSLFTDQNKLERVPFTAMYYRLFERLAAWGFSPRLVIDGFENMVSDKMIQLGVREFMPGTSLYGFYHMAPPPNILCFYTDIRERGIAPLPDKIICNGDRFKEILVKEHFPEEKLVSGAALRYLYLHKMNKASLPAKDGVFKILLTLPLQREAAIEIFNKTVEAVKNNERYHLLVKPHPLGAPLIMAELGKELPGNAKWLEGSMADAINKCDIVVSAATSAAVDCLMANKEVIRVGRETQLDFDPLAWFKEFGAPVYSVEQLKDRLLYMEKKIKSDSYEIPDHSSMLPELFAPETEENMEVFLPEKMKG